LAGNAAADADAQKTCSNVSGPGDTTKSCQPKAVVDLAWDRDDAWCSETVSISGKTTNYPEGEMLTIAVSGRSDGAALTSLNAQVSGNAFGSPWETKDVLPIGGPSWKDVREIDGKAADRKTDKPLLLHTIPNVKRDTKTHTTEYDRTDPGTTSSHKVGVACRFELEVANFLLTIYGVLKYVRGIGRERLQLNNAALGGSFTAFGSAQHWGYRDAVSGTFKYWNGTAWVDTPPGWIPDNGNHFGTPFYQSGTNWVSRDAPTQSWPLPLTDWPATDYTGPGNTTDTTLTKWKGKIDERWTDKFDIKRKECKSSKPECCRYKTRCVSKFEPATAYTNDVVIIVREDVRSDSGMWAMGDNRDGLAPHEFGHLLGAPDEYSLVGTTQYGVSDSDGLSNGIDDHCLMGIGLSEPKRRHYKGICEMLALLVSDQFGKTYTYEAVAKDKNLASSSGTAVSPSSSLASGTVLGAIIGGIVGAVAGAILGFIASGGNPLGALVGGLAGAALGALAGAGLGSLF
jgi:hypothetical protein